jgi:hypothetical protein
MEVCGQLHAPAALPPGKEAPGLLDRRLGGPQNRSGRGGESNTRSLTVSFRDGVYFNLKYAYVTCVLCDFAHLIVLDIHLLETEIEVCLCSVKCTLY